MWKKIIIGGVVVNFLSYVIGGGGYFLFKRIFTLEPTFVWRWTPLTMKEMSLSWWVILVVGNLLLAFIVSVVYAYLKNALPGKGAVKGVIFGACIWLAGVLPVVFTLWILTVISPAVILYFTIQALSEFIIYGAVLAVIYKGAVAEYHSGCNFHISAATLRKFFARYSVYASKFSFRLARNLKISHQKRIRRQPHKS